MPQDVRLIVLNGEEEYSGELRSLILRAKGARIIAEVDELALLARAVEQFPTDLLFVNLELHVKLAG